MQEGRVVSFLASVTSKNEARLAAAAGADVIDCKDPTEGALGALGVDGVAAVRRVVPPNIPVSATIGDLLPDPEPVADAVRRMAATGVDLVKIGIFPGGDARRTITHLGQLALGRTGLVAVLLADRDPDFSLIDGLAEAGFSGVMLDTAGKTGGSLPDVCKVARLREFMAAARKVRLFSGLAGALRVSHIPTLLALKPDVLGFRGALCRAGIREGMIDEEAIRAVRQAIPRVQDTRFASMHENDEKRLSAEGRPL